MRLRGRTLLIAVAIVCALALGALQVSGMRRVYCEPVTRVVIADGRPHPVGRLWRNLGAAPPVQELSATGVNASRTSFRSEADGSTTVLYRAPILGGDTLLQVKSSKQSWLLPLRATPSWNDRVGDGLPEAMRLHDADDRMRFRRWFTTLADRAASMPDGTLPSEIKDCSALLRYSYRIALTRHDDRWYKHYSPGAVPVLPDVQQWNYPETPLGARLFRVAPTHGTAPRPTDFAEFADAKTLLSLNSFRISRNVQAARPGDLLFFRQDATEPQYHSMIVTGAAAEWVVYHTGPDGSGNVARSGEMRRARMADLLQHPDPRWRPTPANPYFLGVYRWNILREE